ncbi:hypothetical protein CRUP_035522 [Coryphaenoides rupestris]|nr:hypothetical protein CRUP_035522 [Coryphaenoides rupestris]
MLMLMMRMMMRRKGITGYRRGGVGSSCVFIVLVLSCCLLGVRCHGAPDHHQHQQQQHHQQQQQQQQQTTDGAAHGVGHGHGRLDRNMVQDQDHIMEHLEGVIEKPEKEMSAQELQLHYFKMHDYDGNNLLDGLELATAITHVQKEEGGENSHPMKEEDLISLIDDVLKDDDKNNDGYIDYAEFAKSLE